MHPAKYGIVAFSIFSFFFLYFESRYETVFRNKETDFLKDDDDVIFIAASGVFLLLLTASLGFMLRKEMNPRYISEIVFTTFFVMGIETLVFKVVARGGEPF